MFSSPYYPDQQMHNMYINNVSVRLHHLQVILTLCIAKLTELLQLQLNKISCLEFLPNHC
jgi:hypothetical protein